MQLSNNTIRKSIDLKINDAKILSPRHKMKYYLFFNTTIANIGGAEIYISNKSTHLKHLGFEVIVVSFEPGDIVIDNLKEYKKYIIPELKVLFRRSNNRIRNKILKIFKDLQLSGTIIIESNTSNLNSWGEFVAKEIGAYHICYLLPEINRISKCEYDFYSFKYKQHCLYGITPHTISDLMDDAKEYPGTYLIAVGCTADTVSDALSFDVSNLPKVEYTILSLGRLNKPYIPYMLESVFQFSQTHKTRTINLLMVGGYLSKSVEKKIVDIQSKSSNLNIYSLGELYPIPQNIFQSCDVSIAVAGCANICYNQGLPNIIIDANDFEGVGIYKYTTNNVTFRTDEQPTSVSSLLEDVLVNKIYKKHPTLSQKAKLDYSKHDELLSIPSRIEYFEPSYTPDSLLAYFVKILIYLFGPKAYFKLIDRVRKPYRNLS